MKLARGSAVLGVAALAAITGSLALADDSGWYVGANAGRSRANIDNARITDGLLASRFYHHLDQRRRSPLRLQTLCRLRVQQVFCP